MPKSAKKDSRSSKRVSVLLKGNYRLENSDFPFAVMTAVNINESGICIATDEVVWDGRMVELNVSLPGNEQLILIAKSLWSNQLSESNLFRTGLKILNIQSPDFKKFKSFYEEQLLYPPVM